MFDFDEAWPEQEKEIWGKDIDHLESMLEYARKVGDEKMLAFYLDLYRRLS